MMKLTSVAKVGEKGRANVGYRRSSADAADSVTNSHLDRRQLSLVTQCAISMLQMSGRNLCNDSLEAYYRVDLLLTGITIWAEALYNNPVHLDDDCRGAHGSKKF